MIPDRFAPVLAELAPLAERFAASGHRLYLVGGTVRDLLVGARTEDIDIDLTTDARPPEIKRRLDGWADSIWTQGERFGTIGAQRNTGAGKRTYEITTFRAESYADDSRKPHVVFADAIESDLSRRDFTVNAMALELTGATMPELVDPFGGAADPRHVCCARHCTPRSASPMIRCGCFVPRVSSLVTSSSRTPRSSLPSSAWPAVSRSSRRNASAMSSTS